MAFLAKDIIIFKSHNRYKIHTFGNKEKAQRFWQKCKRKGLDAQLVY